MSNKRKLEALYDKMHNLIHLQSGLGFCAAFSDKAQEDLDEIECEKIKLSSEIELLQNEDKGLI